MKKKIEQYFFLLIAFFATTIYLSNDAFTPLVESISADLMVKQGKVIQAITTFILGSFIIQLFVGTLSDRFGRKTILMISGVLFVIANYSISLTHNINTLLLLRVITGSSLASIASAGFVSISEYYDDKTALRYLSYSMNISICSPLFGSLIGAKILELTGDWRNIFRYDSYIMVVVLILLALFMPETNKSITEKDTKKTNTKQLSFFKGMLSLLKNKVFLMYCIPYPLANFAFMIWIAGSNVILISNLHLDEIQYGYWQVVIFSALVLGNTVTIFIINKIGILKTVNFSYIAWGINSVLFILVPYLFPENPIGIAIPMFIFLFIRGIHVPAFTHFIIQLSGNSKGLGTAISGQFLNLFGVLGSFVAAKLSSFSNNIYFDIFFIVSILLATISLFSMRTHSKLYKKL